MAFISTGVLKKSKNILGSKIFLGINYLTKHYPHHLFQISRKMNYKNKLLNKMINKKYKKRMKNRREFQTKLCQMMMEKVIIRIKNIKKIKKMLKSSKFQFLQFIHFKEYFQIIILSIHCWKNKMVSINEKNNFVIFKKKKLLLKIHCYTFEK